MEETYTPEMELRDAERSRVILAALGRERAALAAELMSISYRAGVQHRRGEGRAPTDLGADPMNAPAHIEATTSGEPFNGR